MGRIGLSDLKKLEVLFLIAGEEGILCKVSIVRSDSEGLGFREDPNVSVSSNMVAAADGPP